MKLTRAVINAVAVIPLALAPAAAHALSPAEVGPATGQTIVTLTLDDGLMNQMQGAQYLAQNGLRATFFVNSAQIAVGDYMGLQELHQLQSMGHEIGGHGLTHTELTTLDRADIEKEVCGDRAALAKIGVPPQNFAYPHDSYNDDAVELVRECGYNSARSGNGLFVSAEDCDECPAAETLPLDHRWNIRTPKPVESTDPVGTWRNQVERAREAGGGWVVQVFHGLCEGPDCGRLTTTPEQFYEYVDWLASLPNDVSVQPVQQVVGGEFQPIVGEPPEEVGGLSFEDRARRDTLSSATAFEVLGLGIGQMQMIFLFCGIAVIAVLAYRISTRYGPHRYLGGNHRGGTR